MSEYEFVFDLDSILFSIALTCSKSMCAAEYAIRQKKHNVYHMGLVTRQGAEKSLQSVRDQKFRDHYPVPPKEIHEWFQTSVTMNHNSIFLAGKLRSYRRDL